MEDIEGLDLQKNYVTNTISSTIGYSNQCEVNFNATINAI